MARARLGHKTTFEDLFEIHMPPSVSSTFCYGNHVSVSALQLRPGKGSITWKIESNACRTQQDFFPFANITRIRVNTVSRTSFTAPKTMDASPFGTLSGELRNRIYHYFFQFQLAAKVQVDIRNGRPRLQLRRKEIRSALALTATSRLLRRETLAMFWSLASFRIEADTLTAYSYPGDTIAYVKPMNHAYETNKDRAKSLKRWLKYSGILRFAHIIRPVEIDLGVWDPSIYAYKYQAHVLRLIQGSTMALTSPLRYITTCSFNTVAECTLVFRVSLAPATALGPIHVPNDRKQALAVVEKLCEGRQAMVQANFQKGILTRHGYSVLFRDIVSCRAVADLLVGHIVEEKEEESDDSDESVGTDGFMGQKGNA
jgi:hypothetical protein